MRLLPLIALLCLSACESVTAEQHLQRIDYEIRKVQADLIRSQAECQAQAVEFAEPPVDCLESLAFDHELAAHSIEILHTQRNAILNEPDH